MEDNKKELKIFFADYNVDKNIVKYLQRIFNIEIITEKIDKKIFLKKLPDLIIFTGGEDVTPSLYGEKNGKFTKTNIQRDIIEKETFDYFSSIPKLGICRGAQFLTVMNGGKLIQHVENHNNSSHSIKIKNKVINISSDHHQMMYPFDLNSTSYELIGHSDYFLSSTYLNGQNNNIKLNSQFLEPEIVYYPYSKSLCIQSHPEWEIGSKDSDYLLELIESKLFNNKNLNNDEEYKYYEINDPIEEIYNINLEAIPKEDSFFSTSTSYYNYQDKLIKETDKNVFDTEKLIKTINKLKNNE